ncbi:MAG: thioester reductase domain-containing protein [Porticoccaceae bacterium]
MSQPLEEEVLSPAKRKVLELLDLAKTDPEIAALVPDPSLRESILAEDQTLVGAMECVFTAYANRPALGTRAYEIVRDPATSNAVRSYLPRFSTITYGQVQSTVKALASAWQQHSEHRLNPGEMVCIMGFTSAQYAMLDYACLYTHGVTVPLQSTLSSADLSDIFATVSPSILASTIDDLEVCANYVLQYQCIRSLVVFDYDPRDDHDLGKYKAAQKILGDADCASKLITFEDLVNFGQSYQWQPVSSVEDQADRMAAIIHSSGSTGTPKGAVISAKAIKLSWTPPPKPVPMLTMAFAPLNHILGKNSLIAVLRVGGAAYFTIKADMSTLLEDIRLVRPVNLSLFPRILEMIYQDYQNQVGAKMQQAGGAESEVREQVRREMAEQYLGDRLKTVLVGGATTSPEIMNFFEACFGIPVTDMYGNTESGLGSLLQNGKVLRPPVIDYRLRDVPELGYYTTDKPYPRGEFCYKSSVGITQYYKQPEATAGLLDEQGYSRTGDVVEERGPDQIVIIDRVKDVLKLSQGEYVALGTLGTRFESGSAIIKQIYLYGNSQRAYLLAVVVPDQQAVTHTLGENPSDKKLKKLIRDELQRVAQQHNLRSFEVPRDFIVEWQPFSQQNGLLSSVRKRLRPALKAKYSAALEAIYSAQEIQQQQVLSALKDPDSPLSTVEKLTELLQMNLKIEDIDPSKPQNFAELGGDSLAAVAFSASVEGVFAVDLPADHILSPTGNLQKWAAFIERAANNAYQRTSYQSIHGKQAQQVCAKDLKLENFIDLQDLQKTGSAESPVADAKTVLLTGANGFLGHIACIDWLEKLAVTGGTLICLIRATDDHTARQRLDEAFKDLDPDLESRYLTLAKNHLQVLAGDISEPNLGLKSEHYRELVRRVDRICHVAALVNHRFHYEHLFRPNVVGTAEIIRLALTERLKPIDFVSSEAVYPLLEGDGPTTEDAPLLGKIKLSDRYAMGYGVSKWAGEQLLQQASEKFNLPVSVFRGDMMLPHQTHKGQINPADMFTRLLFSVIATGLAPYSFYQLSSNQLKQSAHYDGTPVDVVSAVLIGSAEKLHAGYRVFNISNYHVEDNCSLDAFVDWVESAGYPVTRVNDHAEWLVRFEDKLNNLPEAQRKLSALEILDAYRHPLPVAHRSVGCIGFKKLLKNLSIGPEVPHLTETYVHKCIDDMRLLKLID